MTTVVFAVGARPNFVKMAPVIEASRKRGRFRQVVVHTGQHYDERLSSEIIDDLGFPRPDRFLGIGSGSHGEQTGFTLVAFERVLLEDPPELVVVSGDVNATLACALAAAKLGVPVAHVESGLRSGDWSMPEEQNRVLTDRLSDLLFTHSPEAEQNLLAEGIPAERIHFVGNTMIDTLRRLEHEARSRRAWERVGVDERGYALVTLHRPSNVDRRTGCAESSPLWPSWASAPRWSSPFIHGRASDWRRVTGSHAWSGPASSASTRSATSTSSRSSARPG